MPQQMTCSERTLSPWQVLRLLRAQFGSLGPPAQQQLLELLDKEPVLRLLPPRPVYLQRLLKAIVVECEDVGAGEALTDALVEMYMELMLQPTVRPVPLSSRAMLLLWVLLWVPTWLAVESPQKVGRLRVCDGLERAEATVITRKLPQKLQQSCMTSLHNHNAADMAHPSEQT